MGLAQARISLGVSFVQHHLSSLIYPVESEHKSQLLGYFSAKSCSNNRFRAVELNTQSKFVSLPNIRFRTQHLRMSSLPIVLDILLDDSFYHFTKGNMMNS